MTINSIIRTLEQFKKDNYLTGEEYGYIGNESGDRYPSVHMFWVADPELDTEFRVDLKGGSDSDTVSL